MANLLLKDYRKPEELWGPVFITNVQ